MATWRLDWRLCRSPSTRGDPSPLSERTVALAVALPPLSCFPAEFREAGRPRCGPATSKLLPCRIALYTKLLLFLYAHGGLTENILGSFFGRSLHCQRK